MGVLGIIGIQLTPVKVKVLVFVGVEVFTLKVVSQH